MQDRPGLVTEVGECRPAGAQPSFSPSWGTPGTAPSTPPSLQFFIYRWEPYSPQCSGKGLRERNESHLGTLKPGTHLSLK